jgi:hypothetical protein
MIRPGAKFRPDYGTLHRFRAHQTRQAFLFGLAFNLHRPLTGCLLIVHREDVNKLDRF